MKLFAAAYPQAMVVRYCGVGEAHTPSR